MSALYPVAGIWLAFFLGILAYLTRGRPFGRVLRILALAVLALAVVLFLWWAVSRTLAAL